MNEKESKESKESFALLFEQSEYYTLDEACDYLRTKHAVYNVTPEKLLKRLDTHQIPCFFYVSDVAIAGNVLKVKFVDDEKLYDIGEPIKPPTMPQELNSVFYFAGLQNRKYRGRIWFYAGKIAPLPQSVKRKTTEITDKNLFLLFAYPYVQGFWQTADKLKRLFHTAKLPTFPKKTPRDKFQRHFLHTGNYTTIKNLKYATVVNYPIDLALNDVFIQHLGDRAFNGAYVGGKHICHHIAHYGYFDTWQMMTQIVGIDKVIDYNNGKNLYFVDDEIRQLLTKKYGVDDFSIVFDLAVAEDWDYQEALPFLELKESDSKTNKVVFRIYAKDLVIFHKDLLELERRIIHYQPAVKKEMLERETKEKKLERLAISFWEQVADGKIAYKNRTDLKDFLIASIGEKPSNTAFDAVWTITKDNREKAIKTDKAKQAKKEAEKAKKEANREKAKTA